MAREIDPGTLREWLEQGRPVTLLDVRTDEERAEWSIPGSLHHDIEIALEDGIERAFTRIELPADRPVVTVCAHGHRSLVAAELLEARGFEALSLADGMKGWSLAWNVAEAETPSGARVVQVRRTGKGCLSYLVGRGGEAVAIDPSVGPEIYRDLARERGWRITRVLETHVHADHLSRGRALAAACDAALVLPENGRVRFEHQPAREGDAFALDGAGITVLHTPGHTPESACYRLGDEALFSGDTLFLDSVGRPDLKSADPAETRARAAALHRSLARLLALPPSMAVWPCHVGVPVAFDRRPLTATLAEVSERIPLARGSEERFVEAILARIPPTPPNHLEIVRANEAGALPAGDPTDLEAGANRCAIGD